LHRVLRSGPVVASPLALGIGRRPTVDVITAAPDGDDYSMSARVLMW